MVGVRGHVTGTIGPGLIGEVLLPVRGGVEAFYAYATDAARTIDVGTQILVIEFDPPRSVHVQPWAEAAAD